MTSRREKIGLPPGSLVHMGKARGEKVEVTVMEYDEHSLREYCPTSINELADSRRNGMVTWINVDGIHDSALIQTFGETFGLHPLLLEDVMNPHHRPKIEDFEEYIHFTLKVITYNTSKRKIESEQVSFVLGDSWVISFQETPGDIFDSIRERLRNAKGRVRKKGADYLVYALIDVIVDYYFLVTDELDEEIEKLEGKVLRNPGKEVLVQLQKLKKDLVFLRKSIVPVRDAVGKLEKGTSKLIEQSTTFFLRDVYDHTLYIAESIEIYREMLNTAAEVYLSTLSNRLNSVMKVLTIISTIFIPLTFIVGVYGMNFPNMPEIHWKYGYLSVWIVMILVTVLLIYILRRKKWM